MKGLQLRGRRAFSVVILILVGIIVIHVVLDRLFAYKLHQALQYPSVYSKMMWFEIVTRYVGGLLVAWLAAMQFRLFRAFIPKAIYRSTIAVVAFFAYVIGFGLFTLDPTTWFTAFHHVPIGRSDPLLHMDLSFYIYVLPVINDALARILFLYIVSLLLHIAYLALTFLLQGRVTREADLTSRIARVTRRVFTMSGILFVIFALLTYLSRYDLMLGVGNGSFVSGPDFVTAKLAIGIFTYVHIFFLLLVAAVLFRSAANPSSVLKVSEGFVGFKRHGFKRLIQSGGAFVASYILTSIVGALTNGLYVHPNQNTVELPYIKDSIDSTRWALNISSVKAKPFQGSPKLTQANLTRDQNAIQNVRVNDQGQTLSVYNQLQSFKSYFHFDNVSVDRYGNQEVYVSARQMDESQLPVPTWINKTLVYTHGYGVAISPVNKVTQDGLPDLIASDTPQVTTSPIPSLKQPQIYFGTMQSDVIAPSEENEFDYPSGSSDKTSHYAGGEGLPIQGNRLLLAIEKGSLKYYTSNQLTAKSEYLFDRNIYTRVKDIAPFLRYDKDAFPFIDPNTGHIMWMLDAYTQSSDVPYADTFMGTRYIRNSVKVVMDAYTGKTTFYAVDPTDPLLKTYMSVYPGLFTTQIPAGIKNHFRYPQDLFTAQAQAFTRYHMTKPSAFYNQEDLWALANQIYKQNQTQPRSSVYQMIRMPGETNPSFVLSELYTPIHKDNLNGWLVADNGPAHYGELRLYQFPQSKLVFGPMQVENQIDANPSISQQLSLWNQQGSRVVRGNLLLVPIGDAMVYVEPIYLVASRKNSLPQLQRVIVDFNQKVYIGKSLADALQNVIQGYTVETGKGLNGNSSVGASGNGSSSGTSAGSTSGQSGNGGAGGSTVSSGTGAPASGSLAGQGQHWLQKYKQDTSQGNFAAAGQDLAKLGDILNQLAKSGATAGAGK